MGLRTLQKLNGIIVFTIAYVLSVALPQVHLVELAELTEAYAQFFADSHEDYDSCAAS